MIDLRSIRETSWAAAKRLGFVVNDQLPLLDQPKRLRTIDVIVDRIFAMYCTGAIAYGLDRMKASRWLRTEGCSDSLTLRDKDVVATSTSSPIPFMEQIEGMWALCWSVTCVSELDFSKPCSSGFVKMLPDLKQDQRGSAFRARATLRSSSELIAHCDLAYCLHWGSVHSGIPVKLNKLVKPYMISERWRALEWIFSDVDWDELELDT